MIGFGQEMIFMDDFGAPVFGRPTLDWCFGETGRTPQAYPYSYDAHFVWRDFDKHNQPKEIGGEYSDRMQTWDPEAYTHAKSLAKIGWIENATREQSIRFIEHYYGGERECVGFAKCCNVSNGYGIGLFYTRVKSSEQR